MTDTVDAPRRHQQVVNLDELPASIGGKGPRFAFMRKQLGAAAGAQQLGVGVFAGAAPGGAKAARFLEGFVPLAARTDYWDGEDTGEG